MNTIQHLICRLVGHRSIPSYDYLQRRLVLVCLRCKWRSS